MSTKQLLQAGVLIVFAIVAAGCGAPITAETTTVSVERPVEMTTTELPETIVEGEAVPVQDSPEGTATTTTTMPTLKYSQAWIEYQALELYDEDDSLDHTKAINNYMSSNPNDISTPMGALCWAVHELTRSSMIIMMRVLLDEYLIPYLMEEYGITSEQIGNPGPEATEAFLNLVSENSESVSSIDIRTDGQAVVPGENEGIEPVGYTGEAESGSYEDYLEYLRLMHEFAGDGAEWSGAVQAVSSPEIAAAFRAGEGLPSDVQVYADALVAFAKERVGRGFDPSAESDDYYFGELSFPGLASFMQAAKYHQDCKRAAIGDIPGMVDSSLPVVSTTTTTQPAVEEPSPSATVASTTTTTLLTLEYSPAWIESKDLQLRYDSDDLEDIQYSHEYNMTNPNDISTPMGALCWVYHELSRSVTMGNVRSMLDYYSIPALMEEYGVTSEQVGPPGPEATASFIALVSDRSGLFGSKAVLTDDELAFVRMWHDYAGDGTEWADAIRMVASPEMTAAFRAEDGLPEDVQLYANALQVFARERIGVELDLSAESEDTIYEREGFPGREAFMEAAKYHQDCERALIYDSNGAVDAGGGNG